MATGWFFFFLSGAVHLRSLLGSLFSSPRLRHSRRVCLSADANVQDACTRNTGGRLNPEDFHFIRLIKQFCENGPDNSSFHRPGKGGEGKFDH